MTATPATSYWTRQHTIALFTIMAAVVLVGLAFPLWNFARARLFVWLAEVVLFCLFTAVAGQGLTGMWRGVFIDDRNKISLSRIQMFLWSALVLSGYLSAALANVATRGAINPLVIHVQPEIWLLLGITTTSLVASPLLKSIKSPPPAAAAGTAAAAPADQNAIDVNSQPGDARWSDLFRAEEKGNKDRLDLAKIQMFYFTLVLVLAYGAMLARLFATSTGKIGALPALDKSMIALIGISHAGYLANKTIRQS